MHLEMIPLATFGLGPSPNHRRLSFAVVVHVVIAHRRRIPSLYSILVRCRTPSSYPVVVPRRRTRSSLTVVVHRRRSASSCVVARRRLTPSLSYTVVVRSVVVHFVVVHRRRTPSSCNIAACRRTPTSFTVVVYHRRSLSHTIVVHRPGTPSSYTVLVRCRTYTVVGHRRVHRSPSACILYMCSYKTPLFIEAPYLDPHGDGGSGCSVSVAEPRKLSIADLDDFRDRLHPQGSSSPPSPLAEIIAALGAGKAEPVSGPAAIGIQRFRRPGRLPGPGPAVGFTDV